MARNLAEIIPSFFIGPGGERLTPEQIARRREVASSLIGKATDTSPNAGGWTSVIAKGVMGLGHGMNEYRADQAVKANNAAESQDLLDLSSPYLGTPNETVAAAISGDPAVSVVNPAPVPPMDIPDLSGDKQSFIQGLMPEAIKVGSEIGVDPRIIIAQAAQETGWGKSAPGNNFFGIKSHGQSGGQSLNTHEYIDGKRVNINDRFRTFESPEDSVRGYGEFIKSNPRYRDFMSAADLDSQLAALQASGYATDPNYSRSVGAIARGISIPSNTAHVSPVETGFDMGRFGDQINLAEMPASVADVPANLQAQEMAYQPNPQVAAALVGQEPTLPQVSPDVARAVSGDPVEVASNQFVPPAMPDIPAPPPLNPAVERILRDQNSTEGSRRAAQAELTRHMQQQEAYKSAIAERQAQQRAIDTRVGLAQTRGLPTEAAYDDNMWKAAIEADFRAQTTDIQEYEYARQGGYQGSFTDFVRENKRAGASQTNVDTGTIPQGYQAVRDEAGRLVRYEPVPGGPADTRGADEAKESNRKTASSVITNAAQRAREALNAEGLPATGLIGKALSINPVTNAAEVRRQVDVLKSNATVENLNAMRAASPTGGALGSVTEKEGAMLAAKSGTLDPDSPNFLRDLEDYERTMLRIVHGYEEGEKLFNELYGAASAEPEGKTTATGVKWSVE